MNINIQFKARNQDALLKVLQGLKEGELIESFEVNEEQNDDKKPPKRGFKLVEKDSKKFAHPIAMQYRDLVD